MNTTSGSGFQLAVNELSVGITVVVVLGCITGILLFALLVRMLVTARGSKDLYLSKHRWIIAVTVISSVLICVLEFLNILVRCLRSILFLANVNVHSGSILFYIIAQSFTLWMGIMVLLFAIFLSFILFVRILQFFQIFLYLFFA